jgi:hypothetical protein
VKFIPERQISIAYQKSEIHSRTFTLSLSKEGEEKWDGQKGKLAIM